MRFVAVLVASLAVGAHAAEERIVVNGTPLPADTVRQLQRLYPVTIKPGRYWYDNVSGAWGWEGEPIAGQMLPGLKLGGTMRADASRGTSGIYINGRQITQSERVYLERSCQTRTAPGRYWVNARGVGGFEGGPAWFDLSRCGPQQRSSGGSSTRTFCDPDGSCRSSGLWGSILTTPR